MAQGLTVIAAGLLVVLCIILTMFAFIELILKFDQVLRARAERASASQAAAAVAAPGEVPETSGRGDELIAAIGLALQRHLTRRVASRGPAESAASGPAPWASSGRMGIMADRQRMTGRRS